MKIRSQIILAQMPPAIIIILITIFFIISLTVIEYNAGSILFENFKSILSMQRLSESVEELNNYITYNPKSFTAEIKKVKSKIEQELLFQEKSIIAIGEKKELTQSLRKKWEAYQESIHSLSSDNKTGKFYKDLKQTTANIIKLDQDDLIRKKEELLDLIVTYRSFISFFAVISLTVGFLISWVFTGLFLAPLNKMIEIVSKFDKTDKTILLHIKGSEEIDKLSEEFNLMTNRLEEYHQSSLGRVVENYENLRRAFDALPYPLLIFSHNNEVIFINKSASFLFGYIRNKNKIKQKIFYIESSLRESLLKITKQVQLTGKPYISGKTEEPFTVVKKKKKKLFVLFAYPIKNGQHSHSRKSMSVLMVLQNVKLQSVAERETEQIMRTFAKDIQAALSEIQLALHVSLQEEVGLLTEKQKDILYAARERSEELEKLYQDFLKISELRPKNE